MTITVYKHGTHGAVLPAEPLPAVIGTSIPVYIGTAPIQMASEPTAAVNKPILLKSMEEAKKHFGYSDDWKTFTLCEVMKAHFDNQYGSVGPIVLINVFDPENDKTAGTIEVEFASDIAYIDEPVILSSIAITDKILDEDFSVEYAADGRILIKDLKSALAGTISIEFDKMDITKVTASDIVGGLDSETEVLRGIGCVDLVNQITGQLPTILAAPGWSDVESVREALYGKAELINGSFKAVAVVDLPSDAAHRTIASIKTWKSDNSVIQENVKACWPMAKIDSTLYHLSTIAVWRMMVTDLENEGPSKSPSNKKVPVLSLCDEDGKNIEFDKEQANKLNAVGITTAAYYGGAWKLWGPHMANFNVDAVINPDKIFDSSIRMMHYLLNMFQLRNQDKVDESMNRRLVENILQSEQIELNTLVSDGKLLSANIEFKASENTTSDMVSGDFVFSAKTTTTPVAKSIGIEVQYSTSGLSKLMGGDQ